MQNENTTGEIEHNIVLVIEPKIRDQRSKIRNSRRKIDHAVNPKLVMARSYDAELQHTSRLR